LFARPESISSAKVMVDQLAADKLIPASVFMPKIPAFAGMTVPLEPFNGSKNEQ